MTLKEFARISRRDQRREKRTLTTAPLKELPVPRFADDSEAALKRAEAGALVNILKVDEERRSGV